MHVTTATATRLLEEHSDLSGASVGKIISTAVVLGIVHVLTGAIRATGSHQCVYRALPCFDSRAGPDHLSAVAAMATGSSWKAFSLGARWGCGHSLGLLIMAAIFFAAGQTVDLDAVSAYLNYVVGVFMIVLGAWTGASVRRKYQRKVAEGDLECSPLTPSDIKSIDGRSSTAEFTAATGSQAHLAALSPAKGTMEAPRSPISSFHLCPCHRDVHQQESRLSVVSSVDLEAGKPKLSKRGCGCCSSVSFETPWVQKGRRLCLLLNPSRR
jgi:hypothetical protein